jgi:peroxiredoxin Q/BCP
MEQLKINDKAPDINAPDQNGKIVKLDDYLGKKVVLYFYPKDNTPGCTAEACSLRDNYSDLISKGFQVIGVSADSSKSHLSFIEKYSLPFPLIADVDKKVLLAYGAWGEKKMYGKSYEGVLRKTYVISEKGTIKHIIDKVDTKNHAQQILELYK